MIELNTADAIIHVAAMVDAWRAGEVKRALEIFYSGMPVQAQHMMLSILVGETSRVSGNDDAPCFLQTTLDEFGYVAWVDELPIGCEVIDHDGDKWHHYEDGWAEGPGLARSDWDTVRGKYGPMFAMKRDVASEHTHPGCVRPNGHVCQRPSGRVCVEDGCGEPAGTRWGPCWCPEHDAVRIDRIEAGFAAVAAEFEAQKRL